MNPQKYIDNRNKVQFASPLAFAKIIAQGVTTISVGASSSQNFTVAHNYPTTPNVLGWARIQGNNNWIPLLDTSLFTFDKLAYKLGVFPYATNNSYGISVRNNDTAAHTIDVKYWVYIV